MSTSIDSKKVMGAAVTLVEIGFAAAVIVTAVISGGVLLYMIGFV
jgi:hypothetical protein